MFASVDKALDERTIGHNPERLCLMKVRPRCAALLQRAERYARPFASPCQAWDTCQGGLRRLMSAEQTNLFLIFLM